MTICPEEVFDVSEDYCAEAEYRKDNIQRIGNQYLEDLFGEYRYKQKHQHTEAGKGCKDVITRFFGAEEYTEYGEHQLNEGQNEDYAEKMRWRFVMPVYLPSVKKRIDGIGYGIDSGLFEQLNHSAVNRCSEFRVNGKF